MFFTEHGVSGSLFFFLSLSSRDMNSSSELADWSSLGGADTVRLGVGSDVGIFCGGRVNGEGTGGKNSDGELFSESHSAPLFLLDGVLGFECRVLQVLLTTILSSSSSSLSLTNTGEFHSDSGLLFDCLAAEVLLFFGTAEKWEEENVYNL